MMGAITSIWLGLVFLSSIATVHAASMYSVNDVPMPTASAGYSWFEIQPKAINNQGQVIGTAVGNYGSPTGPQIDVEQPFIFSGGKLTNLGPDYGQANAINNAGQVVGMTNGSASLYSGNQIVPIGTDGGVRPVAINDSGETGGTTASWAGQAYLDVNGHQTILTSGPYTQGAVAAINDAGQAVANLNTGGLSPTSGAFLYSGGTLTQLVAPGGQAVSASALNASGDVVGMIGSHALFWDGTLFHDLGTLGGSWGQALAVNAAGVVVGSSLTSSGQEHAFVDQNGVMTDLNSLINANLGLTLSSAVGINDIGQIVATGKDASGNLVSVVLTPDGVTPPSSPVLGTPTVVPEPSTLAVFGLAGLAIWLRRSRRA